MKARYTHAKTKGVINTHARGRAQGRAQAHQDVEAAELVAQPGREGGDGGRVGDVEAAEPPVTTATVSPVHHAAAAPLLHMTMHACMVDNPRPARAS